MTKFILHPEHLDVASHAAGSKALRPMLSTLAVFPNKVVATDTCRLLEVSKPETVHESTLLDAQSLHVTRKAIKKNTEWIGFECDEKEARVSIKNNDTTVNALALPMGDTFRFPEYENVIPKEKPLAFVKLNAQYLRAMADYVEKHGKEYHYNSREIIIEIYGHDKPVMFHAVTKENNAVRGLIMPLRVSEEEIEQRTDKACADALSELPPIVNP